jgi:catechol 2,3-dioxygenase-like lactoylglutathione lyase family enzyme
MKVERLDRVVLLVRDMDRAISFFSSKLGIEFTELPVAEDSGMRACLSFEHQLELISPHSPLPDTASDYLRRWARLLEERDNVLVSISFKVGDVDEFASHAEHVGMGIETRFEMANVVKELIMEEDDTLGIPISFIEYNLG